MKISLVRIRSSVLMLLGSTTLLFGGCGGSSDSSHSLSVTFLDIGASDVPTKVFYKNELVTTVPAVPFATPFPSPRTFSDDARGEGLETSRIDPRKTSGFPTVGSGPRYWGVLGIEGVRLLSFSNSDGSHATIRHLIGNTLFTQVKVELREYISGNIVASSVMSSFPQRSSSDLVMQTQVLPGIEYITEVRDETTNALLDRFGRMSPKAGKNYLVIASRRSSGVPVPVEHAIGKVLEQPD